MVQCESRMAAHRAAQRRLTSGLHEQGQTRMAERHLMAAETVWIRASKMDLLIATVGLGVSDFAYRIFA